MSESYASSSTMLSIHLICAWNMINAFVRGRPLCSVSVHVRDSKRHNSLLMKYNEWGNCKFSGEKFACFDAVETKNDYEGFDSDVNPARKLNCCREKKLARALVGRA